jgi:hypothetical protein
MYTKPERLTLLFRKSKCLTLAGRLFFAVLGSSKDTLFVPRLVPWYMIELLSAGSFSP